MPITEYESEITARVSYRVEESRWKDEERGTAVDMELHDLWMFGRAWRWPELVETFGHRGARYIEKHIFDNVEAE